jgi:hypothetical protein
MNRAKTRMQQFAVGWGNLQAGTRAPDFQHVRTLSQPEWMLVFVYIFFPDGPDLMPQKKNPCHYQPNSYTDQKKPTVGWEPDKNNCNHSDGNDQTSRSPERGFVMLWLKIGIHATPPLTPPF